MGRRLGFDPPTTVLIANLTTLACQAVIMYRLRGRAALRAVWTVLAGAAVTVPVGLALLTRYSDKPWLLQVYGGFVMAVASWLLLAPKRPQVTPRPRRMLGLAAGLLAGLGNGMFNAGGPPSVLYTYSRPIPLPSAKATVQWIFTGLSLYRLAWVASLTLLGLMPPAGRPTIPLVWLGLGIVPLVLAGTVAGLKLAGYVHPDRMRKAVFMLLAAIGLKLAVWP